MSTEVEYQHPLMAAYWKQLDTRFPQVEEVFEDCMVEALTVLTPEGLDAYLEAARVIGKLGRGVEPMLACYRRSTRTAVRAESDRSVVFVLLGNRVERRAVKVGGADGDRLEVVAGLGVGEQVVAAPPPTLKDGAVVVVK